MIFMILGIIFAAILSVINSNFSINCPNLGTKAIWIMNIIFIALMSAVFLYGACLTSRKEKMSKRKRRS